MPDGWSEPTHRAPAGYAALIERYRLDVVPNWHVSYVADVSTRRLHSRDGVAEETYPSSYWPGEGSCDHLEFALKYDGTNLAILSLLFRTIGKKIILDHIRSKPTGKYARRLWFFYEFLTGERLPLDDLKRGNYIDLIEPEKYYTRLPSARVRRQRVNENLPGADYDASLEEFSRKLMPLVEYTLDETGRMKVGNDTADWYRYIDMTAQAEALFRFIERTIETELADELAFLASYDAAKKAMLEVVDMPDRQVDLFVRLCLQNNGRLSGRKRVDHFGFLSDKEVAELEEAVQVSYGCPTTK